MLSIKKFENTTVVTKIRITLVLVAVVMMVLGLVQSLRAQDRLDDLSRRFNDNLSNSSEHQMQTQRELAVVESLAAQNSIAIGKMDSVNGDIKLLKDQVSDLKSIMNKFLVAILANLAHSGFSVYRSVNNRPSKEDAEKT